MLVHRPAIYEHAAALLGRPPQDVIADAGLLFEAHRAACQRYNLSHVVVAMDIYGGDATAWVAAAGRAPETLADLVESAVSLPAGPQVNILSAAERLRRELPPGVQVRVPATGAFSLAAQLIGFEPLLIGLLDDGELVAAALERLAEAQRQYVLAAGRIGCGITLFESAASPPLVRPADFRRLVRPRLARLCGAARQAAGEPAELIMGGPTAPIMSDMLDLRPALVLCDPPNSPAEFLAACRAAGVDLRVNLEPRLRLAEHKVEAHQKLESLARLARGDQPLFVATGVTPIDADPRDVLDFGELVEQVNQV